MSWEQRNVHSQALHGEVTLTNPASLCPCKREEPTGSRNSPDSGYVITSTGKAESSLPAPEGGCCYTAFLS